MKMGFLRNDIIMNLLLSMYCICISRNELYYIFKRHAISKFRYLIEERQRNDKKGIEMIAFLLCILLLAALCLYLSLVFSFTPILNENFCTKNELKLTHPQSIKISKEKKYILVFKTGQELELTYRVNFLCRSFHSISRSELWNWLSLSLPLCTSEVDQMLIRYSTI